MKPFPLFCTIFSFGQERNTKNIQGTFGKDPHRKELEQNTNEEEEGRTVRGEDAKERGDENSRLSFPSPLSSGSKGKSSLRATQGSERVSCK